MTRVFVVASTAALRLALRARLDGRGITVVGDGPIPDGAPPDVDVLVLGEMERLAVSAGEVRDAGTRAIVAVADDGLYVAKTRGRNQWVGVAEGNGEIPARLDRMSPQGLSMWLATGDVRLETTSDRPNALVEHAQLA